MRKTATVITPALVDSLGTAGFGRVLLEALNGLLRADHVSLFAFDATLAPHLVAAESLDASSVARHAGRQYSRQTFYRHDPNVQLLRGHADGPVIARNKAADITDPDYRRLIYERFALVDRLSLIDRTARGWFALNLYRDKPSGLFTRPDIRALQNAAPLVVALVRKQLSLIPPGVWRQDTRPSLDMLERLLAGLEQRLSPREIQVAARALTGMTRTGIALDLDIKRPTVATLTARAYAKLNISSVHELFALCLGRTRAQEDEA